MNTTIDSMIRPPIATRIRHRGALAVAAGVAVLGALGVAAVLVDDADGTDPVQQQQVTTPAQPIEDPLVTRYGAPDSTTFHSGAEQDRLLMLAQRH